MIGSFAQSAPTPMATKIVPAEHRPDRMMIAADEHFDGSRAHLSGADKGAERDRGGERDVACLQNGHQMDGDQGGDHRGDGDRRSEQDEDHHGAGRQAALRLPRSWRSPPCRRPPRWVASARSEERRDRAAGGSPDGSPHRSDRRRAIRIARPSWPRAASRRCWQTRRTRSGSRWPVARAGHRACRGWRRRRRRGRRPCPHRAPARTAR